MKQKKIAIVGWHEGGGGQLHALLTESGHIVTCFINDQDKPPHIIKPPVRPVKNFDYPTKTTFKGLPLITGKNWIKEAQKTGAEHIMVVAPDNAIRQQFLYEGKHSFSLMSYIHPSATILPEAIIEPGAVILAKAFIGYRTKICSGAIINTGVQIDHNSCVHTCANIMPSATICGSVSIGKRSMVGAGATIINSIHIGDDSCIGAGTLIRHDVQPKTVVVGNPAYILRTLE